MTIIERFLKSRKFGVPIMGIETEDQAAVITALVKSQDAEPISKRGKVIIWDLIRGPLPANEGGKVELQRVASDEDARAQMMSPTGLLMKALEFKAETIICMKNVHRFFDDTAVMQAICNLRDLFKEDHRMLVLLGPTLKQPIALTGDVGVIDGPLPNESSG